MSRTIQVSLPSEKADKLVHELRDAEGIVGLSLQRGASLKPPGDVLTLQTTNEGLETTQEVLARHHIENAGSVVTSEPRSLVSPSQQGEIDRETNEGSWSEMAALLRREANITSNFMIAMFASGLVAAVGLWTDTVHLVVGAMIIAPGFEPIIRVPFGLLAGESDAWKSGLKATAAGYAALAIGAAIALLALMLLQTSNDSLGERQWVQYWSSVQTSSVLVALAAGAAGAAIIAAQRSVLTAGVMVALALIPSASIIGMTLVSGDLALASKGLMRWATDAACVVVGGGLIFLTKRSALRRRQEST